MTRDDLLALTPDALAALANRGLVKRAEKDAPPELDVDPDGTVRARYADGALTTLAPGQPLQGSACSCTSLSICRHVIGAVLAYQRNVRSPAPPFVQWSPGAFTDADLRARMGDRVLTAARRVYRQGYVARVRRPSADDPLPTVELPTCTVRFLVPGELAYVDTDAGPAKRDEVIALAVWAYREADARDPGAVELQLELGRERQVAAAAGLADAVALAEEVLRDGVVNCATSLAGRLLHVRTGLVARDLWWPVAAVDDLTEQLGWYARRHAAYDSLTVAALLAELPARQRAAAGGARAASRLLGTEEVGETPLSRLRLAGLGCRVTGTDGGDRTVEVFLADASSGIVLVLRRRWDDEPQATGAELGRRRIGGARVSALAVGSVVSESARRSASRLVRIASSQIARTTVTQPADPWSGLPGNLVVRDYATAAAAFDDQPPRILRPRVAAEFVRVVEIFDVLSIGYHPGEQRLEAIVTDPLGEQLRISSQYRSSAPAALDALAAALSGELGAARFVSGSLHRSRGVLTIDPLAVAVDDAVVVPDLASGDGSQPIDVAGRDDVDPISAALDGAALVLADGAHLGLHHVPPSFDARLDDAGQALARVGLRSMAQSVERVRSRDAAAWVDAQIRLLATQEAR